jgi:predicted DCC family thiol-disulfide oxidoreductase YuxK
MAELGLTDEDGMAKVWFVDQRGKLSGGAEAVNYAMRHVWWAKVFTYLYPIPGIRQLQDWGYQWVADNRYRMPGSTDACALPVQDNVKRKT